MVLMRMRWRAGTSSGIVALKAGARKPETTPQVPQYSATAPKLGPANTIHAAAARADSAKIASQAMMMSLRLCLSASTPPKGESSPMGRKASTYSAASASGEPVLSVTYQMPA